MKYITKNKLYKISIFILFLFLLNFYLNSFSKADTSLLNRVRGKILLQVEKNGEAWYIDPFTDRRFFLNRPKDAFNLMKELGIGIKNSDIEKIPIANYNLKTGPDTDNDGLSDIFENAIGTDINKADTDNDGYNDKEEVLNNYNPLIADSKLNIDKEFADYQAGKILLQVKNNGEAWYINPDDKKRYFMGKPADAFNLMKNLGLGITNKDLALIIPYQIDEKFQNDNLVKNYTVAKNKNKERVYTDPQNPFSFTYPKDWKIQKPSDSPNITFIGDYNNNLFTENKANITFVYFKTKQNFNPQNFAITEKKGGKKFLNKNITLNDKEAYQEGFKYSQSNSYEITTIIKKNNNTFLKILMISAGDENKYNTIYNKIINSIIFVDEDKNNQ